MCVSSDRRQVSRIQVVLPILYRLGISFTKHLLGPSLTLAVILIVESTTALHSFRILTLALLCPPVSRSTKGLLPSAESGGTKVHSTCAVLAIESTTHVGPDNGRKSIAGHKRPGP